VTWTSTISFLSKRSVVGRIGAKQFSHQLDQAWISGARSWTAAQRESFANDLTRPQLVAVTDNLNESKGDKDVAKWVPPLASYVCTYVRAWVQVKYYYDLTIDSAEKCEPINVRSLFDLFLTCLQLRCRLIWRIAEVSLSIDYRDRLSRPLVSHYEYFL
jgi:hypothetical protein